MRIENINFLKKQYINEYKKIEKINPSNIDDIDYFNAKNGEMTASANINEKKFSLASEYDPSFESEIILNQYDDVDDYEYVLFYGTGLGHHINVFLKKYPDKKVFIYEPDPVMFALYVETHDLPFRNTVNILVGSDPSARNKFISDTLKKIQQKILLIELPVHKKVHAKLYSEFREAFNRIIVSKKVYTEVNYAYQKRWILNGMENFATTVQTQNILLNDKYNFKGKTAILVAAGPSLDDEIENLRYIKENGLAYIFSAGWSIATLLKNEIYPHAFTSYDPTPQNTKVFKFIDDESVKFPLVYGSTIGHETLELFKGPKLHMITSQDTTSPYYLKSKDKAKMEYVMDAPNIATITIQLLAKLGFKRIILVGQNFAFTNDKLISSGYEGTVAARKSETVKDVYGGYVKTEDKFNKMRFSMETFIKKSKDVEYINTTRGGAHIEGTVFKHLDEVMKDELIESFANDKWYELNSINYDIDYMESQFKKMHADFEEVEVELKKIKDIVKKIKTLARDGNYKQVEKMYGKLSVLFNDLKKNVYYNRYIMPMNRVYYDLFLLDVEENKNEKNQIKKAENIINILGKFLFECEKDIKKIQPTYKKIQEQVSNYISRNRS